MKELLGDHIFNKYVEAKSAEWESYQKFVSQWGSRSLFIQDLMIDIYMIREVRSLQTSFYSRNKKSPEALGIFW